MSIETPIRESGRIARLEDQLAIILITRSSACEGCAANGVCHTLSGEDARELRALNRIEAQPGDKVEVEIPSGAALKAAAWVYALPTLLMVVTAIVFNRLAVGRMSAERVELFTALVALGSLALYAFAAWLLRRLRGPDYRDYPVVMRRLEKAPAEAD